MKLIRYYYRLFARFLVLIIKKTAGLSALSCRLVQITGKHRDRIHPKHLIRIRNPWYLKYINQSDHVLDIGCDNGQHTLKAAIKGHSIIGVDNNQQALNLAKREAKKLRITNVKFKYADAEDRLDFKNNKFDLVLLLDVLEHIVEREQMLREIHRILKSEGQLLVSVPNSQTSWKRWQDSLGILYYSDPDHKIEFSQTEIIRLLRDHKFKIKKISPVTLDTPWVGFIDLLGGLSLSGYFMLSKWRRTKAMINPQESIGWEIACKKK